MKLKFEVTKCCHGTQSLQFENAPKELHSLIKEILSNQYYDTKDYKISHNAGAFFQGGYNLTEGWVLIEFWKPAGAENFVKFVEIPDYKRYKILEDFAKSAFTSDCNLGIEEIETTTIKRLRVRPIVSSLYKDSKKFLDDSGNEWTAYDIYLSQDEIKNLEAGKEIEIIGVVIADPKTGKITMLVNEIKYLDENKFDIEKIKQHFDKEKFFIKISPINPNTTSEKNGLGSGVVEGINLL